MKESANPSLSTLTRTYYALEAYVENLGNYLVPEMSSVLLLLNRVFYSIFWNIL